MRIGNMNKLIKLLQPVLIDDGFASRLDHIVAKKLWAEVLLVSDSERFRAETLRKNVTLRFVIRTTEVAANWQIEYNGNKYEIASIKEINKFYTEVTAGIIEK